MNNEFFSDLGMDPMNPEMNMPLKQQHLWTTFKILEFLEDPERIPDKYINRVSRLATGLLINEIVEFTVGSKRDFPAMTLNISRGNYIEGAMLISPEDFLDQLQDDPLYQLTVLVQNASLLSDYWTNRNNTETDQIMVHRSLAYAAQFLIILRERFGRQNKVLILNEHQQEMIEVFPDGIKSLRPDYIYMPPEFTPPDYDAIWKN